MNERRNRIVRLQLPLELNTSERLPIADGADPTSIVAPVSIGKSERECSELKDKPEPCNAFVTLIC